MRRNLLMIIALFVAMEVRAEVKMASLFVDNMVLQQQCDAAIWGWATPKSDVNITTTWGSEKVSTKADKDGRWSTTIPTPEAGGPYSITVSDGAVHTINNVLIGEVWLCSGQSNMQMQMSSLRIPVEGSADCIMKAKRSTPIRVCRINNNTSTTPLDTCDATWLEHTPDVVANSSATAYFFADYLHSVLEVPVGVIVVAWGGTPIQPWMDEQTLKSFGREVPLDHLKNLEAATQPKHKCGAMIYNALVAPIEGYNVKGLLWYQGESNALEADLYRRLLPAYVDMMRRKWDMPQMPFYAVQVAPFDYTTIWDSPKYTGVVIREAQSKAMAQIPNSGMISLLDLGEEFNIHPAKKREVGARLAYHALVNDYDMPFIEPRSPKCVSHEINGDKVTITFDAGKTNLVVGASDVRGFEVAGVNQVFYPATSVEVMKDNTVVVSSLRVPIPVAVRYACQDYTDANLSNRYGIPADQFRTDDWELK